MLLHAVTQATSAVLDGATQCFEIVFAGLPNRSWFSQHEAGKNNNDSDGERGLKKHGV